MCVCRDVMLGCTCVCVGMYGMYMCVCRDVHVCNDEHEYICTPHNRHTHEWVHVYACLFSHARMCTCVMMKMYVHAHLTHASNTNLEENAFWCVLLYVAMYMKAS